MEACPILCTMDGWIEWWKKWTRHSVPRSVSHARCSQITGTYYWSCLSRYCCTPDWLQQMYSFWILSLVCKCLLFSSGPAARLGTLTILMNTNQNPKSKSSGFMCSLIYLPHYWKHFPSFPPDLFLGKYTKWLHSINFDLIVQFTRDRFRRGDKKGNNVANTVINEELTAKSHNSQNYSRGLWAS